ncbi:MAG: phenylalanine--tRNA ligase subunit beta, partial [Candidatus Zipacnadales bacterium]
ILDPIGCPRYTALLVRGIKVSDSPAWMQRRLQAAGIRPISNVVDCTNYVMWELGQPLHAFDAQLLAKDEQGRAKIIVRRAKARERFISLDDQERLLEDTDVVIADPTQAVALAGIMGGANSEVSEDTVDVLIESAHFNPILNRKTALRLGMDTEATYRFQRIVDPEGTLRAALRCAQLLVETAGGELAAGHVDVYPGKRELLQLALRPARANAILGIEIPPERMADYLRRLDMEVTYEPGQPLRVTVPSFRPDIEREIDLIEEIAIVHGYENIPSTLPSIVKEAGGLNERQRLRARLGELLRAAGLCETINLAMIDPKELHRLGFSADAPEWNMIGLQRPTDEGLSALRRTLMVSLLQAAEHNANQRVTDVALYEIDRVFIPVDERCSPPTPQVQEQLRLGVLITGSLLRSRWNATDEMSRANFYTLKGILEEVLEGMGISDLRWVRGAHPTFRPGHCAQLLLAGQPIGVVGEVAAEVQSRFNLAGKTYLAELDAEAILTHATLHRPYRALMRYPAALRDLAVVVDDTDECAAANLADTMREAGGELLVAVEPFDVFIDPQRLGEGKRSIAFSLTFQSPDRTLTDEEINALMERIICALASNHGAVLRE